MYPTNHMLRKIVIEIKVFAREPNFFIEAVLADKISE